MNKSRLTRTAGFSSCLVLIGAAAAGCAPSSAAPADSASGAIEVWSRSGPEAAETYQAVFDAFTQKTGIEVDYLATVEFETQLRSRAAARDLPDVLIYDQSSMANYVGDGMIVPVDPAEIEGADKLDDVSWDSVRMADGQTYGVPFSRHAQVTFVRSDWREAVGLPTPTTHEELLALATAFATQDPDGNGVDGDTFGMAVPGTTDRGFFTWWASSYLWQRGGGVVEGSDGSYVATIDEPESVEAVTWLKDLFCTPNLVQPGALTNASATPFFAEGKAGIYQTGPYAIPNFDKAPGADAYEIIVAPAGPAGSTTLTERTSIYFGATSELPDAQQALAEFLISEEGQELAMTAPGQPVVRLSVNTGVDASEVYGDERWAVVEEQFADSQLLPSDFDFTVIRQDVAETFNAMFGACDAPVEDELAALADRIDEELRNQGAAR